MHCCNKQRKLLFGQSNIIAAYTVHLSSQNLTSFRVKISSSSLVKIVFGQLSEDLDRGLTQKDDIYGRGGQTKTERSHTY